MAPDEKDSVRDSYERLKGIWKPQDIKVLDIGSQDVNGSLRDIFPEGSYTGLDIVEGDNVDLIWDRGGALERDIPFPRNFFSVVVSNSCFEHDMVWWQTLEDMKRVLKPGGILIIGACSLGFPYHGDPEYNFRDYYRFTEDVFHDYILKGLNHTDLIKVDRCGPMRLTGSGLLP